MERAGHRQEPKVCPHPDCKGRYSWQFRYRCALSKASSAQVSEKMRPVICQLLIVN